MSGEGMKSFSFNINNKKVKVKIITHNKNGTTNEVEYGNTGGEEFEFKDIFRSHGLEEIKNIVK